MKILIVDDEDGIRKYLSRILKAHGFETVVAEDGGQSILAAAAERPDLILMDLEMPKMGGTEAIRRLKAAPETRSIPIFVLTGMATPEHVVDARRAGALDFIVKSDLRIDEFVDRCRRVVPASVAVGSPGEPSAPPDGLAASSGQETIPSKKSKKSGILTRERIEAHLKDSVELKALPFVAAEVLKIASLPTSDIAQLTQTLARDPALSASILQLSNSAFFSVQNRVQNLNQAIMRLGLRRVSEVVVAMKLIEEFRGSGRKGGIARLEMWRHALAVAVLARDLAASGRFPPETVEGAFLTGLLHDLGQSFLADHFPSAYAKVVAVAARQGMPLDKVERELCGIDHAEISRRILAKWRFHPEFIEAVSHHDGQPKSGGLSGVVWLANQLARTTRIGSDGDDTIDLVPDELVARIGLDGELVESVLRGTDDQVRQLAEILFLHTAGTRPAPVPSPPLKEGLQAVMVVQTPRLVDPVDLLLKHLKWHVRRAAALGEAAVDPAVHAIVVRARTTEWLREQLDQAVEAGGREHRGRRPLVVCHQGAFPRELKASLRSLGGEAVDSPLPISKLLKFLQPSVR